jgi:hypothetical protein
MRPLLALIFIAATPPAFAQSTTPAAAPAPSPQQANPASAPSQVNPASAPVQPASNAGATERGLAPVQPATGVTPKVSNAANHNTDAAGHTLDPHGKPVGQAPAPTSTTR